jgi:hypothetical protein
VFLNNPPGAWLKSDIYRDAPPVAIPDAVFTVLVRAGRDGQSPRSLGFVFPDEDSGYGSHPFDPAPWSTPIKQVAELSGVAILPEHTDKMATTQPLWPVVREDFDPSCRPVARDIP